MAKPLFIIVKESITELRALQRKQGELISKRIQVLIEIKKGGLNALLTHGRKGGFKPSVVSSEEHQKLKALLNDSNNGIRGYRELLQWVASELGKEMKYTTLVEYVKRHFKSKIKVARKSHVKKDDEIVDSFKKTLVVKSKK